MRVCPFSPHNDPRWFVLRASILLRNELGRRAVGSAPGFSLAGRQYRFRSFGDLATPADVAELGPDAEVFITDEVDIFAAVDIKSLRLRSDRWRCGRDLRLRSARRPCARGPCGGCRRWRRIIIAVEQCRGIGDRSAIAGLGGRETAHKSHRERQSVSFQLLCRSSPRLNFVSFNSSRPVKLGRQRGRYRPAVMWGIPEHRAPVQES